MTLFTRFVNPCARIKFPLLPAVPDIVNLGDNGLRITWDVFRDNTNNADTATISIFNLSETLAQAIQPIPGFATKVILEIGWDGITQQVMEGSIYDFKPRERTPTDAMTVIQIGDGIDDVRDRAISKVFYDVQLQNVIEYFVTINPNATDIGGGGLGLIYPEASRQLVATAQAELPVKTFSNLGYNGSVRDAVTRLMESIGLTWRIHNGQFIAMRGGIINRPGPILRPSTGLLYPQIRNDGGMDIQALAIPSLEPGMQVIVQDDLGVPIGAPVYRVDSILFSGSTMEDNVMDIVAAKSLFAGFAA